eukprot:snap_masked-scaffold_11-processed-gene-5.19-mRNA-1 protein AED:0.12 eAED:1.00 QI:0/0/0/1/1/1/2/0/357
MCMTTGGATLPENSLCGRFGTCVENSCICDMNFQQSLDFFPVLGQDSGARKIYLNFTEEGDDVNFKAFYQEFFRQSPCTKFLPVFNFIFASIIITTSSAFFYSMYFKKTRRIKEIHICRNGILKLSLPEENFYPFNMATSLVVSFLIFFVTSTCFLYFHKHSEYHLKKAKTLYSLKVTYFGFDMEKFFKRQVKFSGVVDIFIFAILYFIPPIMIEMLRKRDTFQLELLELSQIIIIAQNILGLIFLLYLFLLSRILFSALITDLQTLEEAVTSRKHNPSFKGETYSSIEPTPISKQQKLAQLISRARRTRRLLTVYFAFWMIIFALPIFIASARPIFQYVAPLMTGIFFPIISVHFY